jgi:hypothetical protein
MTCPRSIVFDDAPQDRRLGWTADQFADALRSPLAAIGVRRVTDSHSAAVGSECSRKKRSISLAASGPRGSV